MHMRAAGSRRDRWGGIRQMAKEARARRREAARDRRRSRHYRSEGARRFRRRAALVGLVAAVILIASGRAQDWVRSSRLGYASVEAATAETQQRSARVLGAREIAQLRERLVDRRRQIGDSFGETVTRSRVIPALTAGTSAAERANVPVPEFVSSTVQIDILARKYESARRFRDDPERLISADRRRRRARR